MTQIYQFLFVKGGPVMYPIILGSVLALALFLERIWMLRRERIIPSDFRARMRRLLREGKLSEASVLAQENPSSLATIVEAGIQEKSKPTPAIKETVMDVGRREVTRLESRVDLIGTIA